MRQPLYMICADYQNIIDLLWKSELPMNACFASFNTKGYSSALQNTYTPALPEESHITYDGCFNELKYSIGPKALKPMELHLGYARAQNDSSTFDSKVNNYLTIFTKGNKDGEDRDDRPLNSVIILDISGSMSGSLSSKGEGVRLELAKQAIIMFFSKLRQDDSFGLVTFNNKGHTVIPSTRKSNLDMEHVVSTVRAIKTYGGTTLMTGFDTAHNELKAYLEKNQMVKATNVQNRLIMLTDVEDNSIAHAQTFVSNVEQSNIHTTIIGISDAFKSSVCESLNEVKGFNYFCATEIDDLKKYLFENFSFTFFPDIFDIEISVRNQNIGSIEVFGTVDADKVHIYNKDATENFIVTKSKTSFPSELEIGADGQVKTYGGLVLVKLHLKDTKTTVFDGLVHLKYRTGAGQIVEEDYPVHYESPVNQQYYSDECLYEALSGFFYVYEVKQILKAIKEDDKDETRKQFLEPLEKLKALAPKSKLDEIDKLITKLKPKNSAKNPEGDFVTAL